MFVEQSGIILADSTVVIIEEGGTLVLSNQDGIINTDGTPTALVNYGDIVVQPGSVDNFYTRLSVPVTNYGMLASKIKSPLTLVFIIAGVFNVTSGTILILSSGMWYGQIYIALETSVNISSGLHNFFTSIQGNGTFQLQGNAIAYLHGFVDIIYFSIASNDASINVKTLPGNVWLIIL